MLNTRINKMGKQQIQAAEKIIICHDNPYFVAMYGNRQSRFDPDPYIALAFFKNGFRNLVSAGTDPSYWHFDNLKNGIRSIKRLNKDVPIFVYSDDEITKFVEIEKAEHKAFIEASRKFKAGDRTDLINLLTADE